MFTEERKAVYYGKVEIIRGVICDGYVLNNDVAVMSERGAADLLGMDHAPLKRMVLNWPPEMFKPFIEDDFGMVPNSAPETPNSFTGLEIDEVEVVADNSPYKGRKIVVYSAKTIETLIRAYAFAFASGKLRKPQQHIGRRGVFLLGALAGTALDAAIREACGLPLHIQQTLQKQHIDVVQQVRDLGLKSSLGNDIVTKKDLLDFLGITLGKLNSRLRKHREHVTAIELTRQQIYTLGSKASHMKGYPYQDAVKIILSMDSVPGIQIKENLFGPLGIFVKPDTSKEIQWEASLAVTFNGFDFRHNFPLGPYRVDFLIGNSKVVLECNGYEHRYYNKEREVAREQFITQEYGLVRFDHTISWEKLMNAILRVKPGEIIRLTS